MGDPCYTDVFDNGISADHVTGRYMRLIVIASGEPGQPSAVKAFEVFGHVPILDQDLARGKAVQASSADDRYPAKNAVDGYWGTKWRSHGVLPQWLTVDLGTVQAIHACKTWFGTEGLVYNYRIETSTDNQSWHLFADQSNNNLPNDPCYVDYAQALARYVRLVELSHNIETPMDIREFKVYGQSTVIPPEKPSVNRSLIGHWKLDETAGETARDSSGGHNDGILKGSAAWTTKGRIDGALGLRGGSVTVLKGVKDAFTLAFWIKTSDSAPTSSWEDGISLITAMNGGWGLRLMGTTLALRAGTRILQATDTINDGEWHHCAVTRTASGTTQLIVDGNPQITAEVAIHPEAADRGLVFGGGKFNGFLDDVYLFSQSLDEMDLALIATPPPTLVGKWTFKEKSGNVAADSSGNGNDAKFFGALTWSSEGVHGGSISFGDNDAMV